MKNSLLHKVLVAFGMIGFFASVFPSSAITYTFSGGRLGDNLLAYLHAKYISYVHGIPLWYQQFPYSDRFVFHDYEQRCNGQAFNGIEYFKKNGFLSFQRDSKTLYVIPYFPESLEELRIQDTGINAHNTFGRYEWPYFAVDWNDPRFLAEIRALVRPKEALNLIYPPTHCVSVAVHIRKNGGGFDLPMLSGLPDDQYHPYQKYVDVIFPLKHPTDDYYVEQIQYLAHMFHNQPLYVFLFTDDPDPVAILNKYEQLLNNKNIILDCRRGENRHDLNVLEDLFSMLNFDCLIRPDANLSIVADRLGDYKVKISPVHHRWERHKLIIDKVDVVVNKAATKPFFK